MTSIDDLFRKPNAPPKRKLEDPTASFLQHHKKQPNKVAKFSNGDSPHSTSQTNSNRAAFVEDETEENNDADIEAGPSLPPEDIGDEPDEDDEGRFFGGGVSKQEREVLEYIENNEAEETEEATDPAWLRRTVINFERKINKNAELRAKYENDPMKFVGSEADLDAEIKGLSVLSEHGELYPELVKLGCVGTIVDLLAHENTDIVISACQLLAELTDEDAETDDMQWESFVKAMIKADAIDLLVSNLGRLDEASETDRAGVYHVLNVVENLVSDNDSLERLGENERLVMWLKDRITMPDADARAKVSQNRQYTAEILAILLQASNKTRKIFTDKEGTDTLLQLLSAYRKKDPEKDSDEEEFVENLFDCLVSTVKDELGVEKFLDGEGVELCLIMMREGKLSKSRALRILDHACGGHHGGVVGERLIEAAGLKTVFGLLMKDKKHEQDTVEHIMGILASLLRYLPAASAARIRTLAKFVEKDYEKIVRLAEVRKRYESRVRAVDQDIEREREGMSPDEIESLEPEWLSRRFDAGLFSLQTIDVVLSWLVAEDGGARAKILDLLKSSEMDLQVLKSSLKAQLDVLDPEEGQETKEVLEALLQCL